MTLYRLLSYPDTDVYLHYRFLKPSAQTRVDILVTSSNSIESDRSKKSLEI